MPTSENPIETSALEKAWPLSGLCCHYPACGGCQILEQPVSDQLKAKQAYFIDKLKEIEPTEIRPIIASPSSQGYRHKVMLPFGREVLQTRKGGEAQNAAQMPKVDSSILLGCFAKDSHQVVNQMECYVQDPELTQCAYAIRAWAQGEGLSVYDEKKHSGRLRHVLLRKGSGTGQILAGLIVNGSESLSPSQQASLQASLESALGTRAGALKGILLNHNSERTNVTLGATETLLLGSPFIEEVLGPLTFHLRLGSFFQINPWQAPRLFDLAVEDFVPGQKILDLYAGAGTFTLWAAQKTGYAEGWEENADAVQSAKEAAQLNQLSERAHFVCTEVGSQIELNPEVLANYDALLVDPPRKGLENRLCQALQNQGPQEMVYVSCNPNSLARDLKLLNSAYSIERIQPIDMMPHTRHIEAVVHLKRKN